MKKIKVSVLIFLIVFLSFNVAVALDTPPDENDPLVTQSYVELRINQVKTYFDEKINSIVSDVSSLKTEISNMKQTTPSNNAFEPVILKYGQRFIGEAGTEFILRVGTGKSITTDEGGIVDATGGIDIQNNKELPKQHLLIIPRSDGRGMQVTDKQGAIIMVKGGYKIQ